MSDGGGANDESESGGAARRAPKARGSRRRRRRGGGVWRGGVPLPHWGGGHPLANGAGVWGAPPQSFFNFLSRYAAFWVQSDAFSDITRPVPNSLHSQPAESSLSLPVPHWVRDAGHFKGFFTGGEKEAKGAGCEGHRRHCIYKGFRPKVKTAGPGIRLGGRSQYNRPTFCFICCRSTTL